MRRAHIILIAIGCAVAYPSSEASAEENAACTSAPWAAKDISEEESTRLISGTGAECLSRVARMTGKARFFEKRPGWSPGQVALAQHASGYYIWLTYKVPDEWSWYGVQPGDALMVRLEDGTELAFFPACASQVSSSVVTAYYHASREQLEESSLQRATSARQLMTTPENVESEFLERTHGGQSYFALRSAEEPPTSSLQRLARCMLQSDDVGAAAIVVPAASAATKPTEKGPYSKQVQGKLWIEGFIGPSSYNPDRFGAESAFFEISDLGIPTVRGPEFGGAIGGAIGSTFFIGASYRQANYVIGDGLGSYKLMKAGLDMQGVFRFVPHVHPLLRLGVGYARLFGGNLSAVGSETNGLYVTLGIGIRVPLVRWLSFVATFDWSAPSIYPKEGVGVHIDGSQIGGTFGLTLHLVGVK